MVARGRKPTPARLRLVEGTRNATRHGSDKALREKADQGLKRFGRIERPAGLKGEALKAWNRWIAPAHWLDAAREPAAIAFCELWREFKAGPDRFPSSRHQQMRAYMSELGLTDERNRGADGDDKRDEFFD